MRLYNSLVVSAAAVLVLLASTSTHCVTAIPFPLTIHRPQALALQGVAAEMAIFGPPLIQGRSCRGALKLMSLQRSCSATKEMEMLGLQLEHRGVQAWESVPSPLDFRGRIALIRRGACSFQVKVLEAERAGAVGVLIINDAATSELQSMSNQVNLPPPHIPAALISLKDGEMLTDFLEAMPDGVVMDMCYNVNRQRYV